ncbi:ead/Ea22-like family protein [Escherichia coli]|uniref:ead/Ea22-like family protein n=1 Tax=Escherichia coli TaxID=562 RepID=UPI003D6CDEFE
MGRNRGGTMSNIDIDIDIDTLALREAAQNAKDLGGIKNYKRGEQAVAEFESLITPHIVLALLDEREAQSKRIAELEAREILLPERSSMLHRTDFHDDYQTVMAYKVSEVIDAIRATGIRIKGE